MLIIDHLRSLPPILCLCAPTTVRCLQHVMYSIRRLKRGYGLIGMVVEGIYAKEESVARLRSAVVRKIHSMRIVVFVR